MNLLTVYVHRGNVSLTRTDNQGDEMLTTITLTRTANLITVTANGETIATVKDGGNLIGRTDRHLRAAKIHRATGYTVTDAGMVATGADLR